MRKKKIDYSPEELDFVKNNCTLVIGDLHKAFCSAFSRSDVSPENLNSLRKRKKWRTGRTGQFEKGNTPHPNARPKGPNKTSFKKGVVPANTKALYSERVTVDGYIEIKIPEANPYTTAKTRYRLKHQWIWEQANGAVPDGHILHFIDGDRSNCELENLEMIHRGVGAIMNKQRYSSLPTEIKPVVKTLAKIQHRQHELQK